MNLQNNVNDIIRNLAYLKTLSTQRQEKKEANERQIKIDTENSALKRTEAAKNIAERKAAIKKGNYYESLTAPEINYVKVSKPKLFPTDTAKQVAWEQYEQNLYNNIGNIINRSNFSSDVKSQAQDILTNPAADLKPFKLKKTEEGLPIIEKTEKEGDIDGINK